MTAYQQRQFSPQVSGTKQLSVVPNPNQRDAQFGVVNRYKKIFRLRASSVPTLLECPARWKATNLDGLWVPTTVQAKFGTSIHAGVAVYDKRRMMSGDGITEEAVTAFTEELSKPEEGLTWDAADYAKSQTIGLELLKKYFEQVAPKRKFVAVEMTCSNMDVLVEGVVLRLTGTVDRIRQDESGGFGVSDFKTGEQAVRADGTVVVSPHRGQLGVYEILAASVTGVQMSLPAEIIGMQSTGKARVGIGEVVGAAESLIGTEESPGTLVYVAKLLREGIFYGNPKSLLCSAKFCPAFKTCRFRA